MKSIAKILFMSFLLLLSCFENLLAVEDNKKNYEPIPYILCGIEKFPLRGADTLYKMKVMIALQKNDLSDITNKQIAATAYAAMCNFENDPNAVEVNVLMFERCGGSVLLARSQVGEGRKAWGNKSISHGPRRELLRVSEALGKVKKGQGMTTAEDYANVGKIMGISGEQAKALHMELTGYMGLSDFYDEVKGAPPLKPEKRR